MEKKGCLCKSTSTFLLCVSTMKNAAGFQTIMPSIVAPSVRRFLGRSLPSANRPVKRHHPTQPSETRQGIVHEMDTSTFF